MNVVFPLFKTKLRPNFIGPLTVMAKKVLAYTLNLPRKLSTQSVLYAGLIKPYWDPSLVRLEAITPPKVSVPRMAASASGYHDTPQTEINLLVQTSSRVSMEDTGHRASSRQSLGVSRHGMPSMCRSLRFCSMTKEIARFM